MSKKIIILNRQELYDKVWTTPMVKLAKENGLSDVGLAKICKKMNIPRPPAGYWRKLETGHKIAKTPLPKIRKGDLTEYKLTPNHEENIAPSFPPEIVELIKREKLLENRIVVQQNVMRYHPLIKMTKNKVNEKDFLRYSEFKERLNINVSKKNQGRAYRIFNTLILQLEKRGFPISIVNEHNDTVTLVTVQNQKLKIRMYEPQKRFNNPEYNESSYSFNKYIFEYSNKIIIEIDEHFYPYKIEQKVVRDTKYKKLEDRLNEFIVCLLKASELKRKREEHFEKERIKRQEFELKQEILTKEIKAEKEKICRFEKDADAFFRSHQIRLYIQAVKDDHEKRNGPIKEGSEIYDWLKWANEQVDRLDPLKESPPSVLDREEELKKYYW